MGGAFVGRLGLSTRPVLCIHVHSLQQLSQACWRLMSGCLARTRCGTCTIGAVPLARAGPRARVRSAAVCIGPRPGAVTGRGNGRTPGELVCGVVGEPLDLTSDRKPNCRLKTEGPESAVARCGLLVWLWIRVTVRPEKRKRNAPPRCPEPEVRRRDVTRLLNTEYRRPPGPPRGRRRRPGTGVCPPAPPCARLYVTCEKAPSRWPERRGGTAQR